MKLFTKIALVSAMAISANAMASQLQALDDETLSATTGQDGISIKIGTPENGITIDKINVHDTDGIKITDVSGSTATTAGTITLGNHFSYVDAGNPGNIFRLNTNGGTIGIDIDAGATTSTTDKAVLNIKVSTPDNMVITTGDIGVAKSGGATAYGTANSTTAATAVKILDSMDIKLGSTSLNVQLGNDVQGAMIKLDSSITGGITISNLKLNDATGSSALSVEDNAENAGSLFVKSTKITGAGNTALGVNLNIDIDKDGLYIENKSTAKNDVILTGIILGTAPTVTSSAGSYSYTGGSKAIGDVELIGLNTAGTSIRISGK